MSSFLYVSFSDTCNCKFHRRGGSSYQLSSAVISFRDYFHLYVSVCVYHIKLLYVLVIANVLIRLFGRLATSLISYSFQ